MVDRHAPGQTDSGRQAPPDDRRGADQLSHRHRADAPRRTGGSSRYSKSQRRKPPPRVRSRPRGHRIRTRRNRRNPPAGALVVKLERITLRQIRMPLVHFFETSFGRTYERHMILVEAQGDGASGWGEVTAGENPFYNEEWTASAWMILRDYAAPRVHGAAV